MEVVDVAAEVDHFGAEDTFPLEWGNEICLVRWCSLCRHTGGCPVFLLFARKP